MGLFSRRGQGGHRSLASTIRQIRGHEWEADGTGVVSNGDQGGDIQRGDSYSVRFTHPDLPGSLITVSFYAVEYEENPFEFVVQRQVEWMVCEDPRDPGSTETWSDYSTGDVSELICYSADDAEQDAPGALITIWAFAAECGAAGPGDFWVAYRADYMILDGDGDATWSDSIYCGDNKYSEWYASAEAASDAARWSASGLTWTGSTSKSLQVPDSTVTEWFDWDGQPW